MKCDSPLVSVVVITYNSSKYVIETLDSIYNQTYTNLELIISDDCSKDDTIKKCEDWLERNKSRFYRTEIITTEVNTGIPANCNRGFDKAQGEWIKYIAADDCLCFDAIQKYVEYAMKNTDYDVFHSLVDCYINTFDNQSKMSIQPKHKLSFLSKQLSAKEQFQLLCIDNFIYAPTIFIKKEIFTKYGPFDESIRLCEDYPFLLKLTRNGVSLYFINDVFVKYRILQNSATQRNFIYSKQDAVIRKKYIYPYIDLFNKMVLRCEYMVKYFIYNFLKNKTLNHTNLLICRSLLIPFDTYKRLLTARILCN